MENPDFNILEFNSQAMTRYKEVYFFWSMNQKLHGWDMISQNIIWSCMHRWYLYGVELNCNNNIWTGWVEQLVMGKLLWYPCFYCILKIMGQEHRNKTLFQWIRALVCTKEDINEILWTCRKLPPKCKKYLKRRVEGS